MTISASTETFFGKRVVAYQAGETPVLSADTVYRLSLNYDDEQTISELINEFLGKIDKSQLEALIIGMWGEPYEANVDDVIDVLAEHADVLPNLRALFIGDMTYEECEISWIVQGNYDKLLAAYPKLETLCIRGSNSLSFTPFTHASLRSFTIECGGLPSSVASALAESRMPALEHLELWLGTTDYEFDGDVALYQRVLSGLGTPSLTYLGLRDSEIADDLAQWLANEPFIAQLNTLDLSLGTISDEGAKALVNSQYIAKLKHLNLSHHYISEEWQEKLQTLPIQVTLDDAQDDEDDDGYRYVAVGE